MQYLIKCIEDFTDKLPYHAISKFSPKFRSLNSLDRGVVFGKILEHPKTYDLLLYLFHNNVLKEILPPLFMLGQIPQSKYRSKNAFIHTIRVIDTVPIDDYMLRWVALFHDMGKKYTWDHHKSFRHHAKYSAKIARDVLEIWQIPFADRIENIVKHHMYPLAYQRTPNWKDKSVVRFIDRVGERDAIKTIEFAVYDKMAEHTNQSFSQPLIELKDKVKEAIDVKSSDRGEISRAS